MRISIDIACGPVSAPVSALADVCEAFGAAVRVRSVGRSLSAADALGARTGVLVICPREHAGRLVLGDESLERALSACGSQLPGRVVLCPAPLEDAEIGALLTAGAGAVLCPARALDDAEALMVCCTVLYAIVVQGAQAPAALDRARRLGPEAGALRLHVQA